MFAFPAKNRAPIAWIVQHMAHEQQRGEKTHWDNFFLALLQNVLFGFFFL